MDDILDFGTVLLFVSGALVLAIGVRLLASRLGIPTAGLLLVAAAAASDLVDRLATVLTFEDVQRVATLALVVILFEGGSKIGLRRFRGAAAPILGLGIVGTFATAGLLMVSRLRYFSFKGGGPRHDRVPFLAIVVVLATVIAIAIDPPSVLLTIGTLYALSGPVHAAWRRLRRSPASGSVS